MTYSKIFLIGLGCIDKIKLALQKFTSLSIYHGLSINI